MNSKYLKYAVGEIVLVVIGILIALSLNNYNQNRQEREFELKMLQEVSAALTDDIAVFKRFDSFYSTWQESMRFFIQEIQSPTELSNNLDTLAYHGDVVYDIGLYAVYNDGPFEAIKSSGLDLISDDNIRSDLAELYSKDLPALKIWINEIIREQIWNKYEVMDEIFNFQVVFEDGAKSYIIVEDNNFLKDQRFKMVVRKLLNSIEETQRRMRRYTSAMVSLKEKINVELSL